MRITIDIDKTQPLTGTASTDGNGPVSFVGWMSLLRAISELTETVDGSADSGQRLCEKPTIQAIGTGSQ